MPDMACLEAAAASVAASAGSGPQQAFTLSFNGLLEGRMYRTAWLSKSTGKRACDDVVSWQNVSVHVCNHLHSVVACLCIRLASNARCTWLG